MMFTSLLLAAGVASALPTLELETRQTRSNCTSYTSPSVGTTTICRPSDCTATYYAESGDTCQSVAQKFNNFTESIFYYWNPEIGRSCHMGAYVPYCIDTPWYTFTPPIQPAPGTIVAAAEQPATNQPVPLMDGTSASCTRYELAGDGVYMYNMVQDNGITSDQFYDWNPYVNRSNPVTYAGVWYAVGC